MDAVARGDRLVVEVLGPLRVRDPDGRDVTPDGGLQRRLLALLVLRRGRVVSVEAAIDVLWPRTAPRDPTAALHNHLFRLRRALPEGVIDSTGDGYRLDPARIDLDAERLMATLEAVEAATDPAALAALDAVLARWHGPAYPELDDVDDGRAEAARLAELRVRLTEGRAERRLAAGELDGLVADLTALAAAEPLRERPRALLMAALAASGRQADALRAYDDFRRHLGDELGIEPSPALVAQHAALLAGGPDRASGGAPVGVLTGVANASPTWAPPARLPEPAASLIGRDALVDELVSTVQDHRVVTLVGPGGVGKTRLLVEIGHRLRAARAERPVVMCELAPADEESALDVAAAALGIDARPGVGPVERVAAVLGDSEAVVLLDNCEQVLEPMAALVEGLVARCPHVTVVATSRERLRVPGERVCVVPPLDARGNDSTAVQLFLERGRAVAPDLAPEAGDLEVVADIVERLDGLPLAIELAAARLHTHDVTEVAAGLDHRFSLLSSGFRTSSRHGSLRAAVSWSFELLDAPLQRVFADLSVFAGPFAVDDAAAVCDLDRTTVAAALVQLCERSLVMRAPHRRYVLLETLREYGTEQLRATGRVADTCERHARHQVAWIEQADRLLLASGRTVIPDIDEAVPELRSALAWALAHDEVHLAGRLVVALFDYGVMRLRPDLLAWAEGVTEADADDRSPLAASVWVAAAYAAWMAGNLDEMRVRGERALQAGERAGEVPAEAMLNWANLAMFEGRLDEAVLWYRRAVAAARTDRPQELLTRGTQLLALGYAGDAAVGDLADALLAEVGDAETPHAAYVWYCAGEAVLSVDVERARARYARALELAARTNASFVTGLAGASKASIDARLGDPEAAARDYRRLIMHWRRAGMWSTQWTMLRSIAGLLARLGRTRDAAMLVGALRATEAGHRIFGADEVALAVLEAELGKRLGIDAYEAARHEGALLDGDAAVEHALRAL